MNSLKSMLLCRRNSYYCWFIACVLTGCSTIEIKDKDRITDNSFDGTWQGTVSSGKFVQILKPGSGYNRTLFCSGLQFSILAVVSDGVMSAEVSPGISFTSNIDEEGRFYAEIPRKSQYKINGRRRFGAHEYHIFNGTLKSDKYDGQAYYVSAIGAMGEGGCRYPFKFKKKADSASA